MKKMTLIIATALSLSFTGCATTTNDTVAGVKRSQFMLLPASSIDKMSSQAYTQTLDEAKKKIMEMGYDKKAIHQEIYG